VLISRPHQSPPDHFVAICTPEENVQGCGASGTWKGTEKEAAEAWNQRIVHALYPDDIRELTERLKDDHPETSGRSSQRLATMMPELRSDSLNSAMMERSGIEEWWCGSGNRFRRNALDSVSLHRGYACSLNTWRNDN
jgi:hypothetical protein